MSMVTGHKKQLPADQSLILNSPGCCAEDPGLRWRENWRNRDSPQTWLLSLGKGLETEQPEERAWPKSPASGLKNPRSPSKLKADAHLQASWAITKLDFQVSRSKAKLPCPEKTTCPTFSALSYNTCSCLLASGPLSCFPLLQRANQGGRRLSPLGQLPPDPSACTRPLVGSGSGCLVGTMLLKVPLSTSSTQKSGEPSGLLH